MDIKKPCERAEVFEVLSIACFWMSLLDIESSDHLVKLFVESQEKGYIFNKVRNFSISNLVFDCDISVEMFQGDHHLIRLMGLKEIAESH